MKLEFSQQSFENTHTFNVTLIRPVEDELFHADGRTDGRTDGERERERDRKQKDVTQIIVSFRNFARAPLNTAVARENFQTCVMKPYASLCKW
jgi:hypothetical protein